MKNHLLNASRRIRPSHVAAAAVAAVVGLSPLLRAADPAPSTMPSVAAAPATQPAPTMEAITGDIQKNFGQVHEVLGNPEALTDPAERAKVAPQMLAPLQKLVDDFDQLAKIDPDNKQEALDSKADFTMFLALFGDSDARRTLATQSASTDPAVALDGKRSLMMVSWLSSANDVERQTGTVDKIEKLAKENPKSTALTVQLFRMSQMGCSSPDLAKRLTSLVSDVMKNEVADQARQQLQAEAKLAALENKPLTIAGKTPEGKDFTTADWKGKVILVDFWATWCGPCREELPRVKKMYTDYHAKGLEILGVSNDQSADDLAKYIKDDGGMPWPQLFDADAAKAGNWNPITQGYGINGIPTMFLIDKKGIVRTVEARESMERLIPKLLAETEDDKK
jgi:thiol-disulfide isomerase/thioredoxin